MTEIINLNEINFSNKNLSKATKEILKLGETVRKCAYRTAYIMASVDESECYKDDGFNSVHEWAMKTFGFKKSASYTLLKVGKEYTREIRDSSGNLKGYGSNLFPVSEDDFTTTQIEKMIPGGHELAYNLVQAEEITPDMTCKEIEKVIKSHTHPVSEETEAAESETEAAEPETEVIIVVCDDEGNKYEVPASVLEKYRV